jgi:hypothetical protein
MRVNDSFRAYVLEQLSDVKGLLPRAMFGGVGLYAGDHFFGILAADSLYFKVDDSNAKPTRPRVWGRSSPMRIVRCRCPTIGFPSACSKTLAS